jgi:hypothetical protein
MWGWGGSQAWSVLVLIELKPFLKEAFFSLFGKIFVQFCAQCGTSFWPTLLPLPVALICGVSRTSNPGLTESMEAPGNPVS